MDEPAVDLKPERPHSGRMYDYYLGGRTDFPADREAAGAVIAAFPHARVSARANRAFMRRSTRYLAGCGPADRARRADRVRGQRSDRARPR